MPESTEVALNVGSRWPGSDQILQFAKSENASVLDVVADRETRVGKITFDSDVLQVDIDTLVAAIDANRPNWNPDKLFERARLVAIIDNISTLDDVKGFLKKFVRRMEEGDRIT